MVHIYLVLYTYQKSEEYKYHHFLGLTWKTKINLFIQVRSRLCATCVTTVLNRVLISSGTCNATWGVLPTLDSSKYGYVTDCSITKPPKTPLVRFLWLQDEKCTFDVLTPPLLSSSLITSITWHLKRRRKYRPKIPHLSQVLSRLYTFYTAVLPSVNRFP